MRGFYKEGQFSNVPEDVSDILVWGFKKTYTENGLNYQYVKPINSKTGILYAMSDNQMLAYVFPHRCGCNSSTETKRIYKVVLTEQYLSELSEIMDTELSMDELLTVIANVFKKSKLFVVVDNTSFISRIKRKTDVVTVYTFDTDEDTMTFISTYKKISQQKQKKQKSFQLKEKSHIPSRFRELVTIGEIPQEVIDILYKNALPCYEDYQYYSYYKTKILYKENESGLKCYVFNNNIIKKCKVTNNFIQNLSNFLNKSDLTLTLTNESVLEWLTKHQCWMKKSLGSSKLLYNQFSVYIRETKNSERLFLGLYQKTIKR